MNANMTDMSCKSGLEFHMQKVVPAKFKESLFINAYQTLVSCSEDIGLSEKEIKAVLAGDNFVAAVRTDEETAGALGIRGHPLFVFNTKLALSGAQSVEVFLEVPDKIQA